MDIEGLGKLMEQNHADTLRQFDEIRLRLQDRSTLWNTRLDLLQRNCGELTDIIKDHSTTLVQIKTIGSLLGLVWGAIVVFLSNFITSVGK